MVQQLIRLTEVSKNYRKGRETVRVLDGISLGIDKGDFVGLMGPSGSGKTTLLNLLGGLDKPTEGAVEVDGKVISTLSPGALAKWRSGNIGFVFQFYNLLPVLSSIENVELPLLLGGVGQRESRDRAMLALEQVDLGDWAGHRPAQLSGGQRQRVTIARALVNDPAIVWGDEPTGDLDSTNASQIMDLLEDLNDRNQQTFVIVTHDENIGRRANRTIHMRDGLIEGETIHRQLGS